MPRVTLQVYRRFRRCHELRSSQWRVYASWYITISYGGLVIYDYDDDDDGDGDGDDDDDGAFHLSFELAIPIWIHDLNAHTTVAFHQSDSIVLQPKVDLVLYYRMEDDMTHLSLRESLMESHSRENHGKIRDVMFFGGIMMGYSGYNMI